MLRDTGLCFHWPRVLIAVICRGLGSADENVVVGSYEHVNTDKVSHSHKGGPEGSSSSVKTADCSIAT